MVAIAITRMDLMRSASAKSRDAQWALALVLRARQDCGADLRDGPADAQGLGASLNAEGLAGLSNHRGASRPRRPPADAELVAWLEAGPDTGWCAGGDRSNGGRFRWASPGWARLPSRCAPATSKTEPEAQEAFKKTEAVAAAVPEAASDKPLEVWFQDQARVPAGHAHPGLEARNPAPGAARHPLPGAYGAVCPAAWPRGRSALRRHNDHLAEISRTVAHAVLILADGGHALVVPDNFSRHPPAVQSGAEPGRELWQYLTGSRLSSTTMAPSEA